MANKHLPLPANEMDRVIELSDFDLDYASLEENFKDLTRLAAKIAGTEVSMVNLVDTFTQWSVSSYGLDIKQMPREDSVCTYTILSENEFEVKDLSADERFRDKAYVTEEPKLRYYLGVPLQTPSGYNLGALCVLDKAGKEIPPEKVELLRIIADEIVNRLLAIKMIQQLRTSVRESNDAKRKVAHDIRGPLGGIIGLANIISQQGDANRMEDVLEFIRLIQKSSHSLLELSEEILNVHDRNRKPEAGATAPKDAPANDYTLEIFRDKLLRLYGPQAVNKKLDFTVDVSPDAENLPFARNKLLQIAGNLISNAMKFTPPGGKVAVTLTMRTDKQGNLLTITVRDTGIGMDAETVSLINSGNASSTNGTEGEKGYGFGLPLVKHLVEGMNGTLHIESHEGKGALFTITLPQKRLI